MGLLRQFKWIITYFNNLSVLISQPGNINRWKPHKQDLFGKPLSFVPGPVRVHRIPPVSTQICSSPQSPQALFCFQKGPLTFPSNPNSLLCWLLGKVPSLPSSATPAAQGTPTTPPTPPSVSLVLKCTESPKAQARDFCLALSSFYRGVHSLSTLFKSPSMFSSLFISSYKGAWFSVLSFSCRYKYLVENNCWKIKMLHPSSAWIYEPEYSIRWGVSGLDPKFCQLCFILTCS